MNRYPYEPVARYLGGSDSMQAEILGVTRRQVQRYKREGLTPVQAERLADSLRLLSFELWPELLDDVIANLEIECAADDCQERFDPQAWSKKPRRYCSRRCQVRVNARRRRQLFNDRRMKRCLTED